MKKNISCEFRRNFHVKIKLNSPGTLAGPQGVPWGDYLKARPLGRGRPAARAAGAGVAKIRSMSNKGVP